MAGDWIKMRVDLGDDPAVVVISTAAGISEDETVGKLHRLWSWADKHTTDGAAPAITPRWVDKYVGCSGFADAMVKAGWISFHEGGVVFPRFDRHNGQSAKQRGENALRQRLSRENRDNGATGVTRLSIPRPFVRHVLIRDNYTCVYCGKQSDEGAEEWKKTAKLSVDHIQPITRGGLNAVENMVCACRLCNNEKNDRTPEEWGMELEFLQLGVEYKNGQIVTDVSQQIRDKNRTAALPKALPEKRREENKTYRVAEHPLPDWLPADAWIAFCEMRRLMKKPINTNRAANGVIADIDKLRKDGHSPLALIDEATKRNWLTVYEPKQAAKPATSNQFAGAV